MDNSARADWKLDPKNQSGVFLGFDHRRNLYGTQILVDKSIITARHQIAYDVELFPFQKRDNSNDRLQFLQWLLHRKTDTISDTATDNDDIHSGPLENSLYSPNESMTIVDSSDDEQVQNFMHDVNSLSKVPPFNILDSETRRTNFLFTFLRRLTQMLKWKSQHHLIGDRHARKGLLFLWMQVTLPRKQSRRNRRSAT